MSSDVSGTTNSLIELKNTVIDQFRQASSKRDSYMLSVSSTSTDISITLPQIINLNPNLDYEIGLIRFEAYNSIYNITAVNNNFRYSNNNGAAWRIITLLPGAYEVDAINTEIQRQIKFYGDFDNTNPANPLYYFKLYPNLSTLRSVIELTNNYQVDFNDGTSPANLRKVLGYNQGIYNAAYNQSQNIIMIQSFNSLYINCDLCTGSYLNNDSTQALRTFTTNIVQVGFKFVIEPSKPIFLSVPKTKNSFNDYHVWITDEKGNFVNFNGENISLTMWLRSV